MDKSCARSYWRHFYIEISWAKDQGEGFCFVAGNSFRGGKMSPKFGKFWLYAFYLPFRVRPAAAGACTQVTFGA